MPMKAVISAKDDRIAELELDRKWLVWAIIHTGRFGNECFLWQAACMALELKSIRCESDDDKLSIKRVVVALEETGRRG